MDPTRRIPAHPRHPANICHCPARRRKVGHKPVGGAKCVLNAPEKTDLSEAAGELASFASVDTETGRHQEWRPVLEGELDKARVIQSEVTGLRHREMEQAVISVFLSSQPIGHRALTNELIALLGAANPDKIELEKALRRWTELSWFLDEVEIGETDSGDQLPKAWRLAIAPTCVRCTTTPAIRVSQPHS